MPLHGGSQGRAEQGGSSAAPGRRGAVGARRRVPAPRGHANPCADRETAASADRAGCSGDARRRAERERDAQRARLVDIETKPINEITEQDLEDLVAGNVGERLRIEYKASLPGRTDG